MCNKPSEWLGARRGAALLGCGSAAMKIPFVQPQRSRELAEREQCNAWPVGGAVCGNAVWGREVSFVAVLVAAAVAMCVAVLFGAARNRRRALAEGQKGGGAAWEGKALENLRCCSRDGRCQLEKLEEAVTKMEQGGGRAEE